MSILHLSQESIKLKKTEHPKNQSNSIHLMFIFLLLHVQNKRPYFSTVKNNQPIYFISHEEDT